MEHSRRRGNRGGNGIIRSYEVARMCLGFEMPALENLPRHGQKGNAPRQSVAYGSGSYSKGGIYIAVDYTE